MSREFINASSEGLSGTQSSGFQPSAFPVCFSGWFYFDIADAPYTMLEMADTGSPQNQRMQITKTGDDNIQYFLKDNAGATPSVIDASTDIVVIDTWYHFVAWSDASDSHDLRVTSVGGTYGDISAPTTVTDGVNWPNVDRTHIGFLDTFSTNFWDGKLAEFGYWGVTIPDDGQRQSLAAGYSPDHFLNGMTGYAPLMGISDPEPDLFNGDTYALVNTPTKADHPRIIRPSNRSVFFVPAAAVSPGLILPRPPALRQPLLHH